MRIREVAALVTVLNAGLVHGGGRPKDCFRMDLCNSTERPFFVDGFLEVKGNGSVRYEFYAESGKVKTVDAKLGAMEARDFFRRVDESLVLKLPIAGAGGSSRLFTGYEGPLLRPSNATGALSDACSSWTVFFQHLFRTVAIR